MSPRTGALYAATHALCTNCGRSAYLSVAFMPQSQSRDIALSALPAPLPYTAPCATVFLRPDVRLALNPLETTDMESPTTLDLVPLMMIGLSLAIMGFFALAMADDLIRDEPGSRVTFAGIVVVALAVLLGIHGS